MYKGGRMRKIAINIIGIFIIVLIRIYSSNDLVADAAWLFLAIMGYSILLFQDLRERETKLKENFDNILLETQTFLEETQALLEETKEVLKEKKALQQGIEK
jgi:hypothetical protein